jgi:molybdate transport system substrate-binding protein
MRFLSPGTGKNLMRMIKRSLKLLRIAAVVCAAPFAAPAGEVTVAVASNFLMTAQGIARAFETGTGHRVNLVNGSSGTLFAQISHGAPYDVFLSADRERIALLDRAGKIAPGKRGVYALGKLVLVSLDRKLLIGEDVAQTLTGGARKFAMANPALAPYGYAAQEVLENLGLGELAGSRAVLGANAAQAAVFVKTGNAGVGFLALPQVMDAGFDGAWIEIPAELYSPIEQEAALLVRASDNPAALGFYEYLSSENARADILASGYGLPE